MTKPLAGHSKHPVGEGASGKPRPTKGYKSKEIPGWKKIEVPMSQDYRERRRASKDVPVPPELHLP